MFVLSALMRTQDQLKLGPSAIARSCEITPFTEDYVEDYAEEDAEKEKRAHQYVPDSRRSS